MISKKSCITGLVLFLSMALLAVILVVSFSSFGVSAEPSPAEKGKPGLNREDFLLIYFPVFAHRPVGAEVQLTWSSTRDSLGIVQERFYLGEIVQYAAGGLNHYDAAVDAGLTWRIDGPCGSIQVFSDSVSLSSGPWEHLSSHLTPECSGSYLGTVELDYRGYTETLNTSFEVHLPSQVVTNTMHGFDRCALPTVSQMQTWWDLSPYYVWNIYLGGILFFCPTPNLNQSWVQAVAQQGWQFTFTWVGPQPPCSQFSRKFSSNPSMAFLQGIDEAAAALDAAEALGISGEKIIYYDLEMYPNPDATCKAAVNSFLEGWTEWLHLNESKAGVYAAPCYANSNITDWWDYNSPRPDDVWLAHWIWTDGYLPSATVWSPCLADTYWPGFQRLRQYSGDAEESWGGVVMSVDSNIMNGEITAVTGTLTAGAGDLPAQSDSNPPIEAIDLVTPQAGWVLHGSQLLWTSSGGDRWDVITPDLDGGVILDADFINPLTGWVSVLRSDARLPVPVEARIYRTVDGGRTWEAGPVLIERNDAFATVGIAAAHLAFVDAQAGFVVLKQQSGSSFSLGSLYATLDGGRSWQKRFAPLGEEVVFRDARHGWMTGGPNQDQIYYTQDGGLNWQLQVLPGLPEGELFVGQPQFDKNGQGVLPVTVLEKSGSSLVLYTTAAGRESWQRLQSIPLAPGYQPGAALPFSRFQERWWSGIPDSSTLYTADGQSQRGALLAAKGLPAGLVVLDFADEQKGWALVQESACFGDKIPGGQFIPGANPFSCLTGMRLFRTSDGGQTWQEVLVQ